MKILLIGSAGTVGRSVVNEATVRRHHIITGDHSQENKGSQPATEKVSLNTMEVNEITLLAENADVIISAVSPCNNGHSIREAEDFSRALLTVAMRTGKRILIAGYGSSVLGSDDGTHEDSTLKNCMPEATAMRNAFAILSSAGIDYTVLVPGGALGKDEKPSSFPVGGRTVMAGSASANESISAEDFAIALLNEVERPTPVRPVSVEY